MPQLAHGSKTERCPVCGLYFPSTEAGDAHRTGNHGTHTGPDRRRCLTTTEMQTQTRKDGTPRWRQDRYGRWTTSRPRPTITAPAPILDTQTPTPTQTLTPTREAVRSATVGQ